ncbi:YggS family pyridoxal phosphate-dependent enzyme [Saccharospirillum sp. MSK14-1]|uniref:YggS family pyridoxal phosphate-dependent enzyme n=1 Tax=Saccharospirillum sp. MSK14-1 TaxID=1897632 RepID=UPI001E47E782|nr:YggS family pyridoxal phosphate-dependent enzyme [Saccharospirillum sp. MSK14-1]
MSPEQSPLNDRLANVNKRIQAACDRVGRSPDDVTLVAVSKTWPLTDLQAAVAAGVTDLGENYVQEAVDKVQQWQGPAPVWHFIGPLQSNKTRPVAEHFDWVHSIDRLKIAQRLADQRPDHLPPLNVCIQINISQDPAKAGIAAEALPSFADQIRALPRLRLGGIMAITAADLNESELRRQFKELKSLSDTLIQQHPDATVLSMGMSADFEVAIECGATHVRVGSAIFGQRHYAE